MSLIQRPIKHNGTRTYVTEVAIQPNDPILDNEVDGDFDTMYADYNGHIVDANIDPAAGISTAKIAPDGHLVSAHLDPAAGIKGAQLANQPNGVTTAKINIGATTPTAQQAAATAGAITAGVETNICVLPSMTIRGGIVLLMGNVPLWWFGAATANIITRIYEDALLLSRADYTINNASGAVIGAAIPCPQMFRGAGVAGAHVYKFTAQNDTGILTVGPAAGLWGAVELA